MGEPPPRPTEHGTCVLIDGAGVLLRGRPGAGKSDLALRLMDDGARLVADDRVELTARDGAVMARAPDPLKGLMEVGGIGLIRVDPERLAAEARLALVVDLVEADAVERLPAPDSAELLGIALPRIDLAPFEASAPIKLRLAVGQGAGVIMPQP
ncbi:MAG: HPr kinase/phosphatase C-terminal domain-containing protein [Alphaproteobacteria bacterium]|nr:HPr kinase/phosphatase C-terminal domain-containing protein [Alphaproteobacteria bacterium]